MMLGCKLNVSKFIKLLGEMRAKSPDDWSDGSNHFIFSFSFSITYYSIDYYFRYGKLPPIFVRKRRGRDRIDKPVPQFFPRDVGDCDLTFGLMGLERIHRLGTDQYHYAFWYSPLSIA